jgi:hypothetical protein
MLTGTISSLFLLGKWMILGSVCMVKMFDGIETGFDEEFEVLIFLKKWKKMVYYGASDAAPFLMNSRSHLH